MAIKPGRPKDTLDRWLKQERAMLDWLEEQVCPGKTVFEEDDQSRRWRLLEALEKAMQTSSSPEEDFNKLRSKWNRFSRQKRLDLHTLNVEIPNRLHKALARLAKSSTITETVCELIENADGQKAETKAAMKKAVEEVRAREEQKINSAQYQMKDQLIWSQGKIRELELMLNLTDVHLTQLFTQVALLEARLKLLGGDQTLSQEQAAEAARKAKADQGVFVIERKDAVTKAMVEPELEQARQEVPPSVIPEVRQPVLHPKGQHPGPGEGADEASQSPEPPTEALASPEKNEMTTPEKQDDGHPTPEPVIQTEEIITPDAPALGHSTPSPAAPAADAPEARAHSASGTTPQAEPSTDSTNPDAPADNIGIPDTQQTSGRAEAETEIEQPDQVDQPSAKDAADPSNRKPRKGRQKMRRSWIHRRTHQRW